MPNRVKSVGNLQTISKSKPSSVAVETLAAIAKSTASQIVMIRGGSNWALYHVENLVQIIAE
jgi:hypothetical protein